MVDACTTTVFKIRKRGIPPNIQKHCILQQRLVKKRCHCFLVGQTSPFLSWSFPIAFFAFPFGLWWSGLLAWKADIWGTCSREDTLQHSRKYANSSVIGQLIQPCWHERHHEEVRFCSSVYDSGCCACRSGTLLATRADHYYNRGHQLFSETQTCQHVIVKHPPPPSHPKTKLTNNQKNLAGALCIACRTDRKHSSGFAHKCKK